MKAKTYLLQIQRYDEMINNKLVELQKWRDIATDISVKLSGDKVQTSGNGDKIGNAVSNYVTIEQEINEAVFELAKLRSEIIRTIEVLNVTYYDVLHKIYVQGLQLWEVADIYKKSYSWITTTHSRAIKALQAILDERENESIT